MRVWILVRRSKFAGNLFPDLRCVSTVSLEDLKSIVVGANIGRPVFHEEHPISHVGRFRLDQEEVIDWEE